MYFHCALSINVFRGYVQDESDSHEAVHVVLPTTLCVSKQATASNADVSRLALPPRGIVPQAGGPWLAGGSVPLHPALSLSHPPPYFPVGKILQNALKIRENFKFRKGFGML